MASLYQRMKDKLAGTKKNFSEKINRALYYKNLDEDFFDELEESLILSDMSIETSEAIIDQLQKEIKQKGIKKSEEVLGLLESIMTEMVTVTAASMQMPAVMLVVGVNGVGKTTTIAKLAQRYKNEGKTVMLAAADTFRAAAAEQLEAWAERIGVDIIASASGADPASVVYDALHAAHSRHADVLICDTAGRLHNKVNLMNELEKLSRIIDREGQGFDVHNLLAVAVDDFRLSPLFRRHRVNNRLGPFRLLFGLDHIKPGQCFLVHPRHHLEQTREGSHFLQLMKLI